MIEAQYLCTHKISFPSGETYDTIIVAETKCPDCIEKDKKILFKRLSEFCRHRKVDMANQKFRCGGKVSTALMNRKTSPYCVIWDCPALRQNKNDRI